MNRCFEPSPWPTLLERQQVDQAACLLGTAVMDDPMGFGRILRDSAGHFLRIVEERDCTPEERAIKEVNPSCYVFKLPELWNALGPDRHRQCPERILSHRRPRTSIDDGKESGCA